MEPDVADAEDDALIVNADADSGYTDPLLDNENEDVSYRLNKLLGFRQGFALMVTMILGSGIFISPALVAKDTSSVGMFLITWIGAGIVTMIGALCYCELGCMIKTTGGSYAFIRYAYGRLLGFTVAVMMATIINPSGTAVIALSLGTYAGRIFYDTDHEAAAIAKVVAYVVVAVACVINCISVKLTTHVQLIFALAQIGGVAFIVALGAWKLGTGHVDNFMHPFNGTAMSWSTVPSLGLAFINALYSYDGWTSIATVTEEISNLNRNLYLVTVTSVPFVMFCYVSVNVSFLTLLTQAKISISPAVGVDFVRAALGHKAGYAVVVLVVLAAYGTLNSCLFSNPRFTMAAAREGDIPQTLSLIHKRSRSPVTAIMLESSAACILLISKSSQLNSLIELFSLMQWIVYGLCIFAVISLRIQKPDLERPFKIFLLFPIVGSMLCLGFVVGLVYASPVRSAVFLGIWVGVGLLYGLLIVCRKYNITAHSSFEGKLIEKLESWFSLVPCDFDKAS